MSLSFVEQPRGSAVDRIFVGETTDPASPLTRTASRRDTALVHHVSLRSPTLTSDQQAYRLASQQVSARPVKLHSEVNGDTPVRQQ